MIIKQLNNNEAINSNYNKLGKSIIINKVMIWLIKLKINNDKNEPLIKPITF